MAGLALSSGRFSLKPACDSPTVSKIKKNFKYQVLKQLLMLFYILSSECTKLEPTLAGV